MSNWPRFIREFLEAGNVPTTSVHTKGMDFDTAVALGLVPGVRRITALGNNPDIDQGTLPEDVWSFGGIYPWMASATALEIVSSSTQDSPTGTGARSVLIPGLDDNYVEVNQTIALNGTTPVAIPINLKRVNPSLIMSAGSNGVNVGNIHIRRVVGGTVQAEIPIGIGFARQSQFTVPAGHTLVIHSILFAITRAGGIDKNVTMATFFQSPNGFYRLPLEVAVSQSTPYRHDGKPGIVVAQKNDVAFRVLESSASDVSATAAFLGNMYSAASLE